MKRRNFINEMKGRQRLQLALAVFLMFGTLGPASALANGVIDATSWTMLAVMTMTSGIFAAVIVISLVRPRYLLIVIPAFMFIISHNGDIARAISGNEESIIESITEPVVITPEKFKEMRDRKIAIYALSAVMVGLGWTMFVIVFNTEARRRGRIESEINIAHGIQQSLLPQKPLLLPSCTIHGKTVPASEVGGDYFDHVVLDDGKVAVVIADVAGHGVGAGIIAAMTKSAFYLQVAKDPAPSQVMGSLNEALAQITDRRTFVTCAYVLLDPETEKMKYATAGHPAMMVRHPSTKDVRELATKNPALGMRQGVPFVEAQEDFTAGETLLLYTDGISETTNKDGDAFGTRGIISMLKSSVDPSHLGDEIIQSSLNFGALREFKDDATVVTIHILAQPMEHRSIKRDTMPGGKG